jgi:hypothetical protein
MTICYDERGRKYELPKYVIAPPTNLSRDPADSSKRGSGGGGGSSARRSASGRGGAAQLELPAVAAGSGGSAGPALPPGIAALADDAPLNQMAVR